MNLPDSEQKDLTHVSTLRVFDLLEDKDEKLPLSGFLTNVLFRNQFNQLMQELRKNNMEICKILTSITNETIQYDPAVQEQLRALGYIQ